MSRPRATDRRIDVHLMLPESLVGEIELALFSQIQGRVPLGAFSKFYERAARRELAFIRSILNANSLG